MVKLRRYGIRILTVVLMAALCIPATAEEAAPAQTKTLRIIGTSDRTASSCPGTTR